MSDGNHKLSLLDNLVKQSGTPTTRSIKEGSVLRVQVPNSDRGYLIVAVYKKNGTNVGSLMDVGVDGIPGNMKITADNPTGKDPKDGIVDIPLYWDNPQDITKRINLPPGQYFVKVEATDDVSAVPEFWNNDFDIVQ